MTESIKPCRWCEGSDEVCVNADCPLCAGFCPLTDFPGVCRYEDRSEKEDLIIKLPCRFGDTIYQVIETDRRNTARPTKKLTYHVRSSTLTWNNLQHVVKDFGKTVFTDYLQAIAALERMKNSQS